MIQEGKLSRWGMEPSLWREAWEGALVVHRSKNPLCAEDRPRLPAAHSLQPFA